MGLTRLGKIPSRCISTRTQPRDRNLFTCINIPVLCMTRIRGTIAGNNEHPVQLPFRQVTPIFLFSLNFNSTFPDVPAFGKVSGKVFKNEKRERLRSSPKSPGNEYLRRSLKPVNSTKLSTVTTDTRRPDMLLFARAHHFGVLDIPASLFTSPTLAALRTNYSNDTL